MGLYATTVDLVGCVLGPRKIVGLIILSSCCALIYSILGIYPVRRLDTGATPLKENEGKLVHVMDILRTTPEQKLSATVVQGENNKAFGRYYLTKLKRTVQMKRYQPGIGNKWVDSSAYFEEFVKQDGFVDSNGMPAINVFRVAERVMVGNFTLSKELLEKINVFRVIKPRISFSQTHLIFDNGWLYLTQEPGNIESAYQRVRFEGAGRSGPYSEALGQPDIVSIVARQRGKHLEPYESVTGEKMSMVYVESAGEEHSTEGIIFRERLTGRAGWLLLVWIITSSTLHFLCNVKKALALTFTPYLIALVYTWCLQDLFMPYFVAFAAVGVSAIVLYYDEYYI